MDVIAMPGKILRIANTMISEASLPNFPSSEFKSEGARISPFDELNGSLQAEIFRRRQQQMRMLRHEHKGMKLNFSLSFVAI